MRCLIVEPDASFRSALSDSILELGHSAVCAPNPTDAERRMRMVEFDILMLYQDMPDGQAKRLMRIFQSLRPEAHVLSLTGCEVYPDGQGARLAPHILRLLAGQHGIAVPPKRPGPLATAMAWLT